MNANMNMNPQQSLAYKTALATIVLIVWCVLWETVGAPLKNGGYWFALKGLVLLPLIPKLRRGERYVFQVMSLVILLYVMEGLLRTFSDTSPSKYFAAVELIISTLIFVWVNQFAYRSRPPRAPSDKTTRKVSWWLYVAMSTVVVNVLLWMGEGDLGALEPSYVQFKTALNYATVLLAVPYLLFIGVYRYLSTRPHSSLK